jgi:hypothetical protein
MSLGRTLCLLLIATLGSCSGVLPNSATPRHTANRFSGAIDAATPVAKVIHDRGIRVPDQQSGVPLLDQLREALAESDLDGAFAGITYDLTPGADARRLVPQGRRPAFLSTGVQGLRSGPPAAVMRQRCRLQWRHLRCDLAGAG